MDEVLKDRTCFIIAHRLNTVMQCDRILVFHEGEILDQGTHAQLLESCDYYSELVSKQLDCSGYNFPNVPEFGESPYNLNSIPA